MGWFYDSVPLHTDMTPGIANAAEPEGGCGESGHACLEALQSIQGSLKRRRSQRIMKAAAIGKANAQANKAALEAAKTRGP